MQRFRADSLSFTAPSVWAEVTLGQFLALTAEDAVDSSAFIITTLTGLSEAELRSQSVPMDFNAFVLDHLSFITTPLSVPDQLPKVITIDGRELRLPTDLGASALIGQMWDVDLVIRNREKQKQPIDPTVLADTLLPVFLWPLLKEETYTDRHEATRELWPLIQSMSCVEGLATAAFFLRSFLSPLPTGRISSQKLLPTPSSRWPLNLRVVWTYLRTITRRSTWPNSLASRFNR